MDDSAQTLTIDARGFLYWGGLPLFIRYEGGALIFPVKHPADRARLKCKCVEIPLDEFNKLEPAPTQRPRRIAGKMPRERQRRIVTRRNIKRGEKD